MIVQAYLSSLVPCFERLQALLNQAPQRILAICAFPSVVKAEMESLKIAASSELRYEPVNRERVFVASERDEARGGALVVRLLVQPDLLSCQWIEHSRKGRDGRGTLCEKRAKL